MKCKAKYLGSCLAGALGVTLALVMSCGFAHAQNQDPFQTDSGVWKSFDRYKEEQKDKLISELTGNPDEDAKAAAARDAAEALAASQPETQNPAAAAGDKTPDGTPPPQPAVVDAKATLAPPDRPLVEPAMPGLTSRFNLTVGTTVDDEKPIARVTNIDTNPDLQLPSQNWLNADQAARLHAEGRDATSDNAPLNVRLTPLPSFKAPPSQRKPPPITVVAAAKRLPEPEPAASDAAACAAIDAYKKRELEAIQSDRHTLSALQAAISELGLKKELNFMVGQDSKIDMRENGDASKSGAP